MNIADLSFLVVEDHEFQREVLVKMLFGLGGVRIHVAVDGPAALRILKDPSTPIDLVLIDADMGGPELQELMRRLGEGGSPASVLLLSSLDRPLVASFETTARAFGVRVIGVMEKPVAPAKLGALIGLHQPARPHLNRLRASGPSFSVAEIAQGLKNDEFEPVFQPKVSLSTGQMRGAEALARWRHPQEGLVAPNAFIQTLEENGLIDSLTWAMLKKSAAFCRRWRSVTGLDVNVSVNLSVHSLIDVSLTDQVEKLVSAEGLDPKHMIMEITEAACNTDVAAALENLDRLAAKGFGLSMDDYGAHGSSMVQPSRIAFTELKIDRSLVTSSSTSPVARAVLESSLDIARQLKIPSVAQGVETQEDWDLLRQIGCDLAQGYFIAKPMDEGTFLKLTRDRTHTDAPRQ